MTTGNFRISTIGLALALVLGFGTQALAGGPTFTEVSLDTDPRWDVVFGGSSYDPDSDTTEFSYIVSVNDDPALSHFTVELPLCDGLDVVGYSPTNSVVFGKDPTTEITGIKWDGGQETGTTETYIFVVAGNVAEGTVRLAVKAGLVVAYGDRGGPSCDAAPPQGSYSISGSVFIDADGDGAYDAEEPPLGNVTVELYDEGGNLVAVTTTDSSGAYTFTDLPAGNYQVIVPSSTDGADFNETLADYFAPTTPGSLPVELVDGDSTGNDFGYNVSGDDILDDLDPDDPDGDGFTFPGAGKTIGFWKHQLSVAIKGKGRAQIDAVTMALYIAQVEAFYLVDPFVLGGSYGTAFEILSSRSSEGVDLLAKQLLGTEFNEFAGYGLDEPFADLQQALLMWGEYLVAFSDEFPRDALIDAKDVFDGINNLGH